MTGKLPRQLQKLVEEFPGVMSALETPGKSAAQGPLPSRPASGKDSMRPRPGRENRL